MKVGFVTRRYAPDYQGGDRILEHRTKEYLSSRVDLRTLELDRDIDSAALGRTLFRQSHPALETYSQAKNVQLIRTFSKTIDALIISHEALMQPFLHSGVNVRSCFLMHNLISGADGDLGKRGWFTAGAKRVERRVLTLPETTVMVLSHREHAILVSEGWRNVIMSAPGIRGVYKTTPEQANFDQIIINGSMAWGLKRRDLKRFGSERRDFSPDLALGSEEALRDDSVLRIGIITDRFRMGFKLKSADLLSRNTALISFVDLSADFPPELSPRSCLKVINEFRDIENAKASMLRDLDSIFKEISFIKKSMQERMSWERFGETILGAVTQYSPGSKAHQAI